MELKRNDDNTMTLTGSDREILETLSILHRNYKEYSQGFKNIASFDGDIDLHEAYFLSTMKEMKTNQLLSKYMTITQNR